MNDYTGIVEVQQGGVRYTNWLLKHGYRLLGWEPEAKSGRHPVIEGAPQSGHLFVRRSIQYVCGRPEGVEPAPEMPANS